MDNLASGGAAASELRLAPAAPVVPVPEVPDRPQLRLIRGGRHPDVLSRRRALLALAAVLALTVTGLATRALGSPADQAPIPVAGHATIAPGETLWELSVAHAPEGTDPRAYLERLRRLNGLDDAPIPAWTVVLLPASG